MNVTVSTPISGLRVWGLEMGGGGGGLNGHRKLCVREGGNMGTECLSSAHKVGSLVYQLLTLRVTLTFDLDL